MAMRLKELAHCVHETLDANKDKWGMIAVETQYLITYELAEKLFAWAGEIDESEVENLNNSFWDAGIQPRDFDEIARAIAIILEARCVTQDEREQKHGWLENLCNNVSENIVKRINRRQPTSEKKHEKEWRFGEFSKFDFIKTYGYMYDSEDEANQDANNPDATCPLLMGLLNSGWLNISAIEDKSTGKITVSVRDENFMFSPFTMLTQVKISFETLLVRHKYTERKQGIQNAFLLYSLTHWRSGMFPPTGTGAGADLPSGCGPHEILDFLESFMMEEKFYPQEIYDFKSLNRQFLVVCKQIVNMMDSMDETMEDIIKQLYIDSLDNMDKLADVECQIIKGQQERDPVTKKFIKPPFKIEHLIYTVTIATLLFYLDMKYDRVMRIDQSFENRFNRAYYDWERESGHDKSEMVQRQYSIK